MNYIDLDRLEGAPLQHDPFDHAVVASFVAPCRFDAVAADFPSVPGPGSHPPGALRIGGHFGKLMAEMTAAPFRAAIERKFALDLEHRPLVYTVRGELRARDGAVHRDSETKLLTVLLYLNAEWAADGGRLRLLRSPDSLDEPAVEIAPGPGTLLVFRCGPSSWHGHLPYAGARRAVQMNWVANEAVARRETRRHQVSSRLKALRQRLLSVRPAR